MMAALGEEFTLVAAEGRAADVGEVGVVYSVTARRSGRNWMSRADGGQGISAVPDAEVADTAIWQPV